MPLRSHPRSCPHITSYSNRVALTLWRPNPMQELYSEVGLWVYELIAGLRFTV